MRDSFDDVFYVLFVLAFSSLALITLDTCASTMQPFKSTPSLNFQGPLHPEVCGEVQNLSDCSERN